MTSLDTPPTPPPLPSERKKWQFSLRSLLIGMTALAIVCGFATILPSAFAQILLGLVWIGVSGRAGHRAVFRQWRPTGVLHWGDHSCVLDLDRCRRQISRRSDRSALPANRRNAIAQRGVHVAETRRDRRRRGRQWLLLHPSSPVLRATRRPLVASADSSRSAV